MAIRTDDNSYVMTRSKDKGLSVEKVVSHQSRKNLTDLYESSLFKYIFNINLDGKLPAKVHRRCVNSIFPSVAVFLCHEQPDAADQLKDIFVANASQKKIDEFESYPDQESGLCFVLTEFLKEFNRFTEVKGFEEAQAVYNVFYTSFRMIYLNLPVAHIFNLIEVAGL